MAELIQKKTNITEQISADGMPIAQPAKPVVQDAAAEIVESRADVPPKDDVDETPIDVMDFLNASARGPGEVKPEDKKVEEKKAEPVKEEPVKDEDKDEDEDKPIDTAKAKPVPRDYSDIDPEHVEAFKHMTNRSFDAAKSGYLKYKKAQAELSAEIAKRDDKIKQLQEGKPQLPDNYYEHENAFLLSPDFAAASTTVNQYNTVLNHWQSQLDAVRSGNADTYQTIHYHPQTGEFYLSKPLPVDKTTERSLGEYLNFTQQKLVEAQAEINIMAKSHKQRVAESVGWVKNFQAQAFKNFETNEQLKAMADDTVSKFPAPFRSNPLAPAFARALITIDQLGKLLIAKNNNAPAKVTAPATKTGNLTAAEIAGEGGSKPTKVDSDVSIDDFNKVKEGW